MLCLLFFGLSGLNCIVFFEGVLCVSECCCVVDVM